MNGKKEAEILKKKLTDWGDWRRTFIQGLDYRKEGIEEQIQSGVIFGDGCKNGGKDMSLINGIYFSENQQAQAVEKCFRILLPLHRQEMALLLAYYSYGWALRKIAKDVKISRYKTAVLMMRGETLIEGLISYTKTP